MESTIWRCSMIRCDRCGERKDDYRFRPGQPYWHRWCIRCERSPVGDFPLPETKEDVWQDEHTSTTRQ
ncbi:protein NinD [Citrobacter sedlakii]